MRKKMKKMGVLVEWREGSNDDDKEEGQRKMKGDDFCDQHIPIIGKKLVGVLVFIAKIRS